MRALPARECEDLWQRPAGRVIDALRYRLRKLEGSSRGGREGCPACDMIWSVIGPMMIAPGRNTRARMGPDILPRSILLIAEQHPCAHGPGWE